MFIAGVCFPGRSAPSPGAALLPAARILPGLWRNQNLRSLLRCPGSGPQGVLWDVRVYIFISFFKKHLFLLEGIESCRKAAAIGTRSCVSLTSFRCWSSPAAARSQHLCWERTLLLVRLSLVHPLLSFLCPGAACTVGQQVKSSPRVSSGLRQFLWFGDLEGFEE